MFSMKFNIAQARRFVESLNFEENSITLEKGELVEIGMVYQGYIKVSEFSIVLLILYLAY